MCPRSRSHITTHFFKVTNRKGTYGLNLELCSMFRVLPVFSVYCISAQCSALSVLVLSALVWLLQRSRSARGCRAINRGSLARWLCDHVTWRSQWGCSSGKDACRVETLRARRDTLETAAACHVCYHGYGSISIDVTWSSARPLTSHERGLLTDVQIIGPRHALLPRVGCVHE